VVKWLLIANIGIYFLDLILKGQAANGPLRQSGAFAVQTAVFEGHVWKFVTFQFLHGSLGHVLLNCVGIFYFGPWLERWWGPKKFLIYYLLCGAAGAVLLTLLVLPGLLPGANPFTTLVGASPAFYGILIGVAVIAPDLRVGLLFPPVELSMRQLAIAVMAISAGFILLKFGGNQAGEVSHFGGAILGFILMRYPHLLGGEPGVEIVKPKLSKPRQIPKLRPRSEIEKDQDTAVDAILDKISSKGFQSLTQAEKDFLHKASNQKKSS
jgi:membrane associated rhomboid family serine protease